MADITLKEYRAALRELDRLERRDVADMVYNEDLGRRRMQLEEFVRQYEEEHNEGDEMLTYQVKEIEDE